MNFTALIDGLGLEVLQGGDADVQSIETNDIRITANTLFVARRGVAFDANNVLGRAVERGACALIVTRRDASLPPNTPAAYIENPERVLGQIAARFYGHPTRSLRVLGVTGTNGKTSVTHLVERMTAAFGARVAIMGTVGYRFDGVTRPAPNTTPDGLTIQAFAREALDQGADTLVMEVSSHGLELGRIAGVAFDVVAMTNITADHLDFHGTFANYRAAKARIFTDVIADAVEAGKSPVAVVNIDDVEARSLLAIIDPRARLLRVTCSPATPCELEVTGTRDDGVTLLDVTYGEQRCYGESPMTGAHNLSNIAMALATTEALCPGTLAVAVDALHDFNGAPGRMEPAYRARAGEPSGTVDYAHTPDAVSRVIAAFADEPHLAVVLGCGGDRDATKRPLMARAAMAAWRVFFTADNPRSESAERIIEQMQVGVDPHEAWRTEVVLDRTLAIEAALRSGASHVLVLGKGHENTQEIGAHKFALGDAEELRRALAARNLGLTAANMPLLAGWSASRVARSMGGRVARDGALRPLGALRYDSRDVAEGDIFVALPGARTDGHAYIEAVVGRGAGLVIARHLPDDFDSLETAVVLVDDVVEALLRLAGALLDEARARRDGLRVVAITGSNGKTTTKELTSVALRALTGREPLVTAGNNNNELGLPLTVSRLTPAHREAVLEMGARYPHDIERLSAHVRHEVAVVTSIGPAHLETMGGSLTAVRRTKAGIAAGRPPEALVMPADECGHPDWRGLVDDRTRVVTVGTHAASLVVWRDGVAGPVTLTSTAELGATSLRDLALPLGGQHNALNLGTAVAAAALCAGDGQLHGAARLNSLLASLELPGGRLERLVIGGRRVVNDAYNANPGSMRASLALLAAEPGERWAVLGDMLELGDAEASMHREVGALAAASADRVVAIGERAREIAIGAGERAMWFGRVEEGATALCGTVPYGAVIWLKASRGMALERVIDVLRSCWEQPGEGA